MFSSIDPIPFAKPFFQKEEEEAVLTVLRSGWLTTGKETLEFEKEFEKFLRSGNYGQTPLNCMAVNSATSGLHLALEAVGVKQGDLILLPSMTFTSSAVVARYLSAEVVFVDVGKDSFHMDPAALEKTLERLNGSGPRGKAAAIIPVHYGGLPCKMEPILKIAEKYKLKVIEDAAHSFPSTTESGDFAGTLGDAGVFSFYATKTITTGEGGMLVTRNNALAERIKIMRSHGMDRSAWNRYTDIKASWYYEVIEPGFKYNMPDLLSALGRVQLRRAMDLFSMRQEIARRYDEAFLPDRHFSVPPTGCGDARHLYPLRLNLDELSISRNEFAEKMQEQGIGISVHFIPLHIMPYYKKRYSLASGDFPETMKTYSRTISLPIWPGMSSSQVDRVITVAKNLGSEYTK